VETAGETEKLSKLGKRRGFQTTREGLKRMNTTSERGSGKSSPLPWVPVGITYQPVYAKGKRRIFLSKKKGGKEK